MELKRLTSQDIELFWLEAMIRAGWHTGKAEIQTSPLMPNYKFIEYRSGKLYFLDGWSSTPNSDKSAGTTKIWFDGIPVWFMSYGGWYPEEHIPFLKLALEQGTQLNSQYFLGGRGPGCFRDKRFPNLVYLNKPAGNFSSFSGWEYVIDSHRPTMEPAGHDYWGMCLI